VEHHEGEPPRHLRVVDRGREPPGEPDGLGGEVYVDVAGVALVEDQVGDAQHGPDIAGLVEPHAGGGTLGPALGSPLILPQPPAGHAPIAMVASATR
jgi:hypothetical protein